MLFERPEVRWLCSSFDDCCVDYAGDSRTAHYQPGGTGTHHLPSIVADALEGELLYLGTRRRSSLQRSEGGSVQAVMETLSRGLASF